MKPISSAITPVLKGASQQTGTPPSGHGSETPSSGALSVQPERLLARTPAENLAAAVSSLQDCGISVKHEVTGSRFLTKMVGDAETTTWEPVKSLMVKSSDTPEADTAERILQGLTAPAPQTKLVEWVTICAALTAAPRDDDTTSELRLAAYVSKLAEYPGDVVRTALADWPNKSKWFPTWAELKAVLDKHMGIRPELVVRVRNELRQRAR